MNADATCYRCPHLVPHHYDDGCSRCDCKVSNTEAEYWAMLHEDDPAG